MPASGSTSKDLSPLSQSRDLSPHPQEQNAIAIDLLAKAKEEQNAFAIDLLAKAKATNTPVPPAAVPKPGISLVENTRLTLQFDAASAERERRAVIAKMLPPMPPAKPKTASVPVVPAAKGPVATTTKLATGEDEAEVRKGKNAHLQPAKIKAVVIREADKQEDLEKDLLKSAHQSLQSPSQD